MDQGSLADLKALKKQVYFNNLIVLFYIRNGQPGLNFSNRHIMAVKE